MKIMLLFALAGLLALPAHVSAEPVVDCGNFPNTQMRLACWNEISRAPKPDPVNAAVKPEKPEGATARNRKTTQPN